MCTLKTSHKAIVKEQVSFISNIILITKKWQQNRQERDSPKVSSCVHGSTYIGDNSFFENIWQL